MGPHRGCSRARQRRYRGDAEHPRFFTAGQPGVIVGLVIGKPLGITLATWLAVRAGLADQPTEFSWRQVAGAGALCGIGFTMSIFIADAAFADSGPLALAKVSVMVACVLADHMLRHRGQCG